MLNGVPVELTSFLSSPDWRTVRNRVRSKGRRAQAEQLILDLRETGLSEASIRKGIDEGLRQLRHEGQLSLVFIRAVGDGFDLTFHVPEAGSGHD